MSAEGFRLVIPQDMLNKLETADKKLAQLGDTSQKTQAQVIASFKAMADGVNPFIHKLNEAQQALGNIKEFKGGDIKLGNIATEATKSADAVNELVQVIAKLVQENDKLQKQQLSSRGITIAQEGQLSKKQSAARYKELQNEEREYMNFQRERERELMRADKNAQRRHVEEMARIKEQIRERQRLTRLTTTPSVISGKQVGTIIGNSNSAVTINQMLTSIKNLEKAKKDLNTTDKNYKKTLAEIDNAINKNKASLRKLGVETENVRKHQSNLMNHAQQLRRALALVFSVSQITGYINKLIQVRGEFELQQRSLQAILQNKDKADKLWQQTVDLAVRSPFRVKELVSYTKQLAAYRVETEKLHETTRMLSDVSAGLGVDMQRLILAYGQVKAANYLRGTELRQFSEAGINILGELAKYFTELEGRAVSVGEVFERVSKRMVAFSDVEEIFKRVTSEGGVFYRMQEIQSETIKGLISNLYDQVDLMLNEIGKTNDGVLKDAIGLVKEFVESWREVAWYLEKAVLAFALYTAATKLAKLGTSSFTQALFSLGQGAGGAAKGITFLKNAWLGLKSATIVGLITTAAFALLELYRNATKASRETERLQKELNEIYSADYTAFKQQTKTFNDLVEKLKNVNEGSQEHRDIIGKLNSQYGEYIGFIVTEATTYDKLKGSIDRVNEALMRKAKINTYEKAYARVVEDTQNKISQYRKNIEKFISKSKITDKKGNKIIPTEEDIINIFGLFEKMASKADKKTAYTYQTLQDIFKDYGYILWGNGNLDDIYSDLSQYGNAILQQKEAELKLEQQINGTYNDTKAKTLAHRKELEAVNEKEKERLSLLEKQGNTSTYNYKKEVDRIKKEAQIERIKVNVEYEFPKATKEEKESIIAQRVSELNTLSATIIDINNKIEKSVGTLGEKYASIIYIDEAEAATGISQIAENTAQAYKAQQEIIKQQNALKEAGTAYDAEVLDNAQKTAKAYYYKLELLGRLDLLQKQKSEEESKELQLLNKQLAALKEAKQTFDSLRQKFSLEESTRRTAKAFEDLFAELEMTQFTIDMSFDNQGIIDVIEELPNKAGKAGEQALEKMKAKLRGGLDVDIKVREDKNLADQIADMFSGYELSLELQKLNIPPDLAKQLFNVDSLTLPELKEKLQGMEGQFVGTEMEKQYRAFLQKVSQMEQKEQEERLKKYIAFSRKAMSERAKIKFEELQTIAEIEKAFAIKENDSEEVKATKRAEEAKAKAKAKKDANDALQKLDWEDFKSSDTFNNIFDDLDNASDEVLKKVINRLKDFKAQWEDMPFDQMRQVVDLLQKAEEALKESDNPFTEAKRLKKAIKEDGRSKEQAQLDVYNAGQQKKLAENALSNYELFEKVANEQIAVNTLTTEQLKEYVYWQELSVEEQKNLVEEMKNEVSYQDDVIQKGNEQQNNIKKLTNVYKKQEDSINQINKLTQDLYGSFMDLAENGASLFGKELDGTTKIFADMGASMADTVLQTVALWINLKSVEAGAYAAGTALNTAMGVIGWIVMGVQLLSQAFKAIVDAHDNGLQKQIDAEAKSVERLQKVYEDLEEQIKNTYDINEFNRATKAAQDNLLAQIAATERIISAEEDKKKSDQDAIDDYKDEIDDLKNSYKELEETRLQELGAFATDENKKSGAEAFLDAWMEAYKQTGDGLSGLNEQFDEFFEDSVKRQMLQKATSKYLENLFNEYDTAISDWAEGGLTDEELNKELSGLKNELPALNEALKKWAEAVGLSVEFAGKNAELSGLSAGIQGITAEQADVLASYWNSVRFYTADTNQKVTDLITRLFDSEGESNPMLVELRAQTALVREIRDVFTGVGGVVRGDHTMGGLGLKVFIS